MSFTNKDYYSLITKHQKKDNKKNGVWFGPGSNRSNEISQQEEGDQIVQKVEQVTEDPIGQQLSNLNYAMAQLPMNNNLITQ